MSLESSREPDWLPGGDVTVPCSSEAATGMLVDDLLGGEPIFALAAFDHGRDSDGYRKPCRCEHWDGKE